MQSKLTLRIDGEVKDAAKELAKRRGASVSQMVENYFRLLLESEADVEMGPADRKGEKKEEASAEGPDPKQNALGPTTRRIAGALRSSEGEPSEGKSSEEKNKPGHSSLHGETKEEDRRVAAQAAARKHGGE